MTALLASVGGEAESTEKPALKGRLTRLWDAVAPWLVAALAAFVLILTIDNHFLAQEAKNLSQANLTSQDNHHANTVKAQKAAATADAELATALRELKASAAAIEYEGGVIAYQNGEIIQAQQQGHATLMVLQALQNEVSQEVPAATVALKAGQAQINAYLHYLTCLGTHQSNTAVCGSAPPLPPT